MRNILDWSAPFGLSTDLEHLLLVGLVGDSVQVL